MKKLVFVAPHLSTGGLPQYLYKQIQTLINDYEIWCLEWVNHTGGKLVVQRNRIEDILGSHLITIGEDKSEIISQIEKIQPDIIHFQEIPEYFIPHNIAERIYNTNRRYKIIETSHDSSYDVQTKRHFPDKFMMVSQYQVNEYLKLGIPTELVEYPIEYKTRTKSREEVLIGMRLDPNIKHVVNVGLFTPRKNQAEIIEYAKGLVDYPIQFHFIGNQADNFQHYWQPLMKDFPKNCTWWGERSDVDTFYEMADLFLFTSRGHATDKETMPLVIREAISWKTPSLIYNLPVYLNYFDKYNTIEYLDFADLDSNKDTIIKKLGIEKLKNKKMEYKFSSNWSWQEQKMYFSTEENIDFPIVVSIKEYKSDSVLWSAHYNTLPKGIQFWIMPMPKESHNYETSEQISGVKICIYVKETNKQIYEFPYFRKFIELPTVSLSNTVPYSMNYYEFFIDRKYDKFINKKFKNVVDVGANVGVFTEYMIQNDLTYNITCVECDSIALRDLKENYKTNPNVTIIEKALYSDDGGITFYHSPENSVISSTLSPDRLQNHKAGVKGNVEVHVPTITVNELVDMHGEIDLLKIDIEGGEYVVIENMDASLFQKINNLFIEFHFFENDYKVKYDSAIDKLKKNGYSVEEYKENQSDNVGTSEAIFATKLK